MDKLQLKDLLDKYVMENITEDENRELFRMLAMPEQQSILEAYLDEYFISADTEEINTPQLRDSIQRKLMLAITRQAPVINMQPTKKIFTIRRIAVAASIILVIGIGSYFLFFNKPTKQNEIVKKQETHDVAAPQ